MMAANGGLYPPAVSFASASLTCEGSATVFGVTVSVTILRYSGARQADLRISYHVFSSSSFGAAMVPAAASGKTIYSIARDSLA